MAKALVFANSLRQEEIPVFLQIDDMTHEYTIHRPGFLYADPTGNKSKRMGGVELLKRFLVCVILSVRSLFYDVLILDVTTMGLLIAPLLYFRRKPKVVVMSFNVLRRRTGLFLRICRYLFRRLDRVIVHSRYDVNYVAELYNIPPEKIIFRPFVREEPSQGAANPKYLPKKKPYIMSYGVNARDYDTLFRAIDGLDIELVIVVRKFSVDKLHIPENVTVLFDIEVSECDRLISNCLFTIFTFDGSEPSCGQISMVTSLMLGKPVICTNWIAVEDYVINGINGLYAKINSADDLREKIIRLQTNQDLYKKLSNGATEWAKSNTIPQAFHISMNKIITEVTQK